LSPNPTDFEASKVARYYSLFAKNLATKAAWLSIIFYISSSLFLSAIPSLIFL